MSRPSTARSASTEEKSDSREVSRPLLRAGPGHRLTIPGGLLGSGELRTRRRRCGDLQPGRRGRGDSHLGTRRPGHGPAGGDDASRLSVEVGEVRGRMALRVMYPSDEIVYDMENRGRYNTQVRVRDDGTFGGGNGGDRVRIRSSGSGMEAHADLRIEIPAGADVVCTTPWVGPAPAASRRT